MKILHLTLKKLPFDVMVTGEKIIEFRKPSKWIISRLQKQYDVIKFTNGYGKDKPYFIAKYAGYGMERVGRSFKYSNGLTVYSGIETVKIYIGEIIEKGNLN
jgi:hypothetical protein